MTDWFSDYARQAADTDRLVGEPNHMDLLAAGLLGEVGGVLAELKKQRRERDAYPAYRKRLREELGDLLWYLARLASSLGADVGGMLAGQTVVGARESETLPAALDLGIEAGRLLQLVRASSLEAAGSAIARVAASVQRVAVVADIPLENAAEWNLFKNRSRWPRSREYAELFDERFPVEEQLPRTLVVDFKEIARKDQKVVILRCNGLNFGDRLTDNIEHPDFYRFHDVFHFAYAVFLGWSPVVRALLRCKRKSDPSVDEAQDGARAVIIEEAISALVFSRAKELYDYDGIDRVDYDLLKNISEFVQGYEVSSVPLWQWEEAILAGYRVFRALKRSRSGSVTIDLIKRELSFRAPL